MENKLLPCAFAVLCSLLLCVQGYFALNDDAAEEIRAERIGASYVSPGKAEPTGEDLGGMSLYLTVETSSSLPSSGEVFVNGASAGTLARGVLTFRAEDGDNIFVKNAKGDTLKIIDYPRDLKISQLPERLFCDNSVMKWGKIAFK